MFDLEKGENTNIADGASMSVSPDGKKATFYSRGNLYITDLPMSNVKLGKSVDLSNMTATVDYAQEWPQIFDETWRAFRDGFYLENMHGVDWNAIKKKYAALLPYAKTRYDLNYIIGEMIAELACGHAYVNPGQIKTIKRIPMGLLGAELSRDKSGYYRIDKIIPEPSTAARYAHRLPNPE